jgi:AcrR family transcriptional regulator
MTASGCLSLGGEETVSVAGLRERNRARTKAEIRRHALRLFQEQGYAATSMAQVAQAAEVSPSTLFRYFPSKEDLAVQDSFTDLFVPAFRRQPADLSPIQAVRGAIRTALGDQPPDVIAAEERHHWLIFATPELHSSQVRQMLAESQVLTREIAARVGKDPGDFAVRNFSGAVFGVMVSAMLAAGADPALSYLDVVDAGLAHLEGGLPL